MSTTSKRLEASALVSAGLAGARRPAEGPAGLADWAPVAVPLQLTRRQRLLKRTFDLALTIPGVLLLLPLFLIIGIAIYLDSGRPIIFRQQRVGEGGRTFWMLKFRTMTVDAESRIDEVLKVNQNGSVVHKHRHDPRVTRIGRILRRTSLDELPQLFNVLLGTMSLVGPRPEMPMLAALYEPWQWERCSVPQGITGLWQIRGRSDRPLHLNSDDDIEYIRSYSIWLDVKILLATFAQVGLGRGAY